MATSAAAGTFRRVWADPEGEQVRGLFEDRQSHYRYLWHWYKSSIYEDLATWAAYRNNYRLYRWTRPIYNPARRIVDFYAGILYPGTLTTDGRPLPDGTLPAIPLAEDTPPELVAALGQLWQWNNWQTLKGQIGRYGACLGDVGIEIVDDVAAGKIRHNVIWPGLIRDLDLDMAGNVQAYRLEYDFDEDGKTYTYAKEVERGEIRTYRDDKPHGYEGNPEAYANPYGFVPFVWIRHADLGGDHGDPALRNLNKWDELNSMAAHVHDHAHQVLAMPVLVSGDGVAALGSTQSKAGPTADLSESASGQEGIKLLKSGPGGDMKTVLLPEGEVQAHMERLMGEIERDHPELGMWQQLREMTQVTGPGAERMFGDVATYVQDARANYDQQLVKLFQMSAAIGGWRISTGAWGRSLTRQQAVFAPFDLASYAAGDLDFEILPRPLVAQTPMERITEERQRLGLERDKAAGAANVLDRQIPTGIAQRLAAQGTQNEPEKGKT